jgi:aldehyde:ferredoxin oxidoreductase
LGTNLEQSFFYELGRETLKWEAEFNKAAGFTVEDDELPSFFYNEPLYPSNNVARFHARELHDIFEGLA